MSKQLFKSADAVNLIKRAMAGSRFCIHIRSEAPIDGSPDSVFANGLCSYLSLSRKEAIRLCRDMLSPTLENRGARIPISIEDSEFLGKQRTVYWIG